MTDVQHETEVAVLKAIISDLLANWTDPAINGDYDQGSVCRYCGEKVVYPFAGVGEFHSSTCPVLAGHMLLSD